MKNPSALNLVPTRLSRFALGMELNTNFLATNASWKNTIVKSKQRAEVSYIFFFMHSSTELPTIVPIIQRINENFFVFALFTEYEFSDMSNCPDIWVD